MDDREVKQVFTLNKGESYETKVTSDGRLKIVIFKRPKDQDRIDDRGPSRQNAT